MRLLKEFISREGLDPNGKTYLREAVRGIILKSRKLLMVYSRRAGDYKFPGGGIDTGETHEEALRREVREECGADMAEIGQPFGKVIEVDAAIQPGFDLFRMTSFYYLCRVEGALGALNLDAYEADLGFVPRWVEVDAAIRTNEAILRGGHPHPQRWVARELFVLKQIKAEGLTQA